MNHSIIFMLIITLFNNEVFADGDDDNSPPPCSNRKVLPFNDKILQTMPQNWYVGRVTYFTKTLPSTGNQPPVMNCCHPLSYTGDHCKGIHVNRQWNENQSTGGLIKTTLAYNDKFDDIAEFVETQGVDTEKFIFQGFMTQMTLHSRQGTSQEIPSYDFPSLIIYATVQSYGIIYYQKNLEWILYMDCDNDVAWIEISEAVVKENRVDDINKEIDDYLAKNPSFQMTKIPTELPFSV